MTSGWLTCVFLCVCFCVCFCVCQSELVAELFQQQGNVSSVANGSVRSGKRATREHKLTVGFQVSCYDVSSLCFVDRVENFQHFWMCFVSVPSVLTDADGHSQQHHSSLRPLYQTQRPQRTLFVRLCLAFLRKNVSLDTFKCVRSERPNSRLC